MQGQLREFAPTARTNTAGHTAVPGGSAAPSAELRWWLSTTQGAQVWFPLSQTPRIQARPFFRIHTPAHPGRMQRPRASAGLQSRCKECQSLVLL